MRVLVSELMTRKVVSVCEEDCLRMVHRLMREQRFHHVCVLDEAGALVGILSDRDVRRALASPLTRRGAEQIQQLLDAVRARRVMSRNLVTVGPTTPLDVAIRSMLQSGVSALPVMEGGRVVGVLTETDCLRFCAKLMDDANAVSRSSLELFAN